MCVRVWGGGEDMCRSKGDKYNPVDISTTVFSYSRAVQYRTILHGCYCTGPEATRYPSNYDVL